MCAYSQCSGTTGTTAAVGPTILSSGGDRRRAVLQLTMRDARWLQASRPAAQAAQVAENTLLRDGIVTSDPSAACGSVVACCAPHGRLLEAFQLGRFQFAHGTEHAASPRARLWLRKAPGTLVWPRVRYIATTVTWRTCLGLKVWVSVVDFHTVSWSTPGWHVDRLVGGGRSQHLGPWVSVVTKNTCANWKQPRRGRRL